MRITIERLRTLVLILGALLIIAIATFLTVSHFRNRAKTIDIPKRLGVNITEQADHVIYTQTHAGHALFKIDAAKVVQVKNGVATLSDVAIDLYGAEGSRVDRIEGKQFEYDQKSGIAKAIGPVQITLMKPGQAPAIAPKVNPQTIEEKSGKNTTLSNAVATAESGDIRVKTSGLVFNQNTGVAQTSEKADFILAQGTGSGIGALFDSQNGHMVLDHSVELHILRSKGSESVPINLNASHAEFERGSMLCHLQNATLTERTTTASATAATILFRDDGSADKLDASGGVTISSVKGSSTGGTTITAPRGHLEFDSRNHPQRGHMDDGVTLDSRSLRTEAAVKINRSMHGTSPTAQLEFSALGDLHTAHLERGVEFSSTEDGEKGTQKNHLFRRWNSPVADLEFQRDAKGGTTLKTIHGIGGSTIKAESQRTLAGKIGSVLPSRIAADDLFSIFNSEGTLDSMTGTGHAFIEQTTETGAHQSATADKLVAHFSDDTQTLSAKNHTPSNPTASGLSNLDHATLVGHVVLVQTPGAITANTANTSNSANTAPVRATAGRADYEGAGEWLHLTQSPRVENGGVEMTAELIDVSRASGDAFAHTNVKATWIPEKSVNEKSANSGFGGQTPTHVISSEAELKQFTGDAIFRGQARLWQGSNSLTAPVITLNRNRQTLLAEDTPAKSKSNTEPPVYAVFLGAAAHKTTQVQSNSTGQYAPQLMRFHGARLKYSAAERKAWLTASKTSSGDTNSASLVTADTGSGQVQSDSMELTLLPAGTTAGPGNEGSTSQVDTLIAHGRVQLNSAGRHGTGEQLIYSGESGEYTLTGTATNPPKLHDPARGTVTGETLIFQSRNDSVKVVGPRTSTETTTQK